MTKFPPFPNNSKKRSEQLYVWYKTLIEHWSLNQPLPSQNIVMKETGVSLATVTTALKRLEEEGLIRRYKGKGTFIHQKDITKYSRKRPTRRSKKVLLTYVDSPSEVLWTKIHYCEEFLAKSGYSSIQFKLHGNSRLDDIVKIIRDDSSIAGIVAASVIPSIATVFDQLEKLNIPVAIIEPLTPPPSQKNIHISTFDYFQSGYLMASYLIGLGHKQIAYIHDVKESEVTRRHRQGIDSAIKDAGSSIGELRMLNDRFRLGETSGDVAYRLTKSMLLAYPEITGIIYDTGIGAHGGILAINQHGKSVPDDISVIGEGDYSHMRLAVPPITVTSFDHRTRAKNAIDAILNGKTDMPMVPAVLIERESTRGVHC